MRLAGAVLKVSLKVHSLWSGSRQPFVPLTPLETVEGWGPGEDLHEQVLPGSSAKGSSEQRQKFRN